MARQTNILEVPSAYFNLQGGIEFIVVLLCIRALHILKRISREREKHARNVNVEAISQVLALFSSFSPLFVGFLARDKGARERENRRERVLTPHSHVYQ